MEDRECPICFDDLGIVSIKCTSCRQQFCMVCILTWNETSYRCPLCNIRPNLGYIQITDYAEIKENRKYSIKRIFFGMLKTMQTCRLFFRGIHDRPSRKIFASL
jgi:hypothetical protein